jgi:pyruvate/2-oxoglutarate/acetoin dehydrogenase E1 component
MGGRRGYGPTHSQSIEKLFFGIPGLTVVAPSLIHDPGVLLERASLELASPCMYIENKLLYSQRLGIPKLWKPVRITANRFPTVTLSQVETLEVPILLVTYGGCIVDSLKAAEQLLISDELVVNVVVPSLVYPIPIDDILNVMCGIKLIVIVEEGEPGAGWGAEIIARLVESHANKLPNILRIGGPSHPIPSSKHLELASIFDADFIANKIRKEMIR